MQAIILRRKVSDEWQRTAQATKALQRLADRGPDAVLRNSEHCVEHIPCPGDHHRRGRDHPLLRLEQRPYEDDQGRDDPKATLQELVNTDWQKSSG